MATYVYCMQRDTKVISGMVVAHTKFVTKVGGWDWALDPRTNAAVERTAAHFRFVGFPDFVVHGKYEDGAPVYEYDYEFQCYFDTGFNKKPVGKLKKVGRTFTIEYNTVSA